MGKDKFNRVFDEEIKKRNMSSDWSRNIASSVLSFVEKKQQLRRKIFDIVSYSFPAAAAIILIILALIIYPSDNNNVDKYKTTHLSIYERLNDTSGDTYDEIDFCIEQYYSQR